MQHVGCILDIHGPYTDDEKRLIITNPEVIAIDQDPLGIAGDRLYNISGAQAWSKPLVNGDIAVVLYNSNNAGLTTVDVTWAQVRADEC